MVYRSSKESGKIFDLVPLYFDADLKCCSAERASGLGFIQ